MVYFLIIIYCAGSPRFTVLPLAQSLLVNQVLRLQCEAEGSPTPEIMWRFNDVMVMTI